MISFTCLIAIISIILFIYTYIQYKKSSRYKNYRYTYFMDIEYPGIDLWLKCTSFYLIGVITFACITYLP